MKSSKKETTNGSNAGLKKDLANAIAFEEFEDLDGDSCTSQEIDNQFSHRYIEVYTVKVTNDDIFCSPLLADDHSTNLASVLSDRNVVIVDRQTFKIKEKFKLFNSKVTDIRFFPTNSNLVCLSSLDGTIKVWDARSGLEEKKFFANDEGIKPITTFDIAAHEKLICAGTECISEDVFILFWDLRKCNLLGGYWESHSNDISCLRFNPDKSETIASAGSDGLINIFDLSQSSEDAALTYCLNAEESLHSFCWRTANKNQSILTYTDTHAVQLWNIQETIPKHSFSRENITKALRRNVSYECYPISLSCTLISEDPILLAGSGLEYENYTCLRSLKINEKTGCLDPHGLFVSKNKLKSMTQIASVSKDSAEVVTVREDGEISLWRDKDTDRKESFKIKKKKLY